MFVHLRYQPLPVQLRHQGVYAVDHFVLKVEFPRHHELFDSFIGDLLPLLLEVAHNFLQNL